MKNILVIFDSGRSHGNTRKAVNLALGTIPHHFINLLDKKINAYSYEHDNQDDEFMEIVEKMLIADIIVFATPVYWYAMSGKMKIFFDRLTDLVTIKKTYGRRLAGKSVYLIASGGEKYLPVGFESVFARTANYLDMRYKKHFYYNISLADPCSYHKELAISFGKEVLEDNSDVDPKSLYPLYEVFQGAVIFNNEKEILLINKGKGFTFPGTPLNVGNDYKDSLRSFIEKNFSLEIEIISPLIVKNFQAGLVGELPHYGVWHICQMINSTKPLEIEHLWLAEDSDLTNLTLFHPFISEILKMAFR